MELDDQRSFMTGLPPNSFNNSIEIQPRNLGSRLDSCKYSVILRLKPFNKENSLYTVEDESTLKVLTPPANETKTTASQQRKFTFSSILGPGSTQEDTFDQCVYPLLRSFLKGNDCVIMTYGTTSAGKSFTMHGAERQPGIIPRGIFSIFSTLKDSAVSGVYQPQSNLFLRILNSQEVAENSEIKRRLLELSSIEVNQRSNSLSFGAPSFSDLERNSAEAGDLSDCNPAGELSVWISMFEIYNEQIIDLLALPDDKTKKTYLPINSDSGGNFYVKGAQQINVNNGHEAFEIYQVGRSNLHRSATALNERSSRSHCVLVVSLVRHATNPSDIFVNRFSFVDLAGSERAKTAQNDGARLNESKSINKSLTTLGKCIRTLNTNQDAKNQLPVPFRDSKLTKLFKNAMCGSEHLTFIVNISLNPILYGETLNVLKFSALAQEVMPGPPKTKTRFSQIALSGRFNLPNFEWGSSQSDLTSMRENTLDATRLQRELASAESKIEDLTQEIRILQERVFESEDLIKDATEEKLAAIKKFEKERASLNELKEKSGALLSEIMTDQKSEEMARMKEVDRIKKELKELEEDYDYLEKKYENLKAKYKTVKEKERNNRDENTIRLIDENQQLKMKVEKLERRLNEGAQDYTTLYNEQADLLKAKASAEETIEDMKRQEDELRSEIEFLTIEVSSLRKDKGVDAHTNTSFRQRSPMMHSVVSGKLLTMNSSSVATANLTADALKSDAETSMASELMMDSNDRTPQRLLKTDAASTTALKVMIDSATVTTPSFSKNDAETSMSSNIMLDCAVNTTPRLAVSKTDAGTSMAIKVMTDSTFNTTPLSKMDANTSMSSNIMVDCAVNTTPRLVVSTTDAGTSMATKIMMDSAVNTTPRASVSTIDADTSVTSNIMMDCAINTTPRLAVSKTDTGTSMATKIMTDSAVNTTPRASLSKVDADTSMSSNIMMDCANHTTPLLPVSKTDVGTSMAAKIMIDTAVNTTPRPTLPKIDAETSISSNIMIDCAINTTPYLAVPKTDAGSSVATKIMTDSAYNTSMMTDAEGSMGTKVTPYLSLPSSADLMTFKSVSTGQIMSGISPFGLTLNWQGSKSLENLCTIDNGNLISLNKSLGTGETFSPNRTLSERDAKGLLNNETLKLPSDEISNQEVEQDQADNEPQSKRNKFKRPVTPVNLETTRVTRSTLRSKKIYKSCTNIPQTENLSEDPKLQLAWVVLKKLPASVQTEVEESGKSMKKKVRDPFDHHELSQTRSLENLSALDSESLNLKSYSSDECFISPIKLKRVVKSLKSEALQPNRASRRSKDTYSAAQDSNKENDDGIPIPNTRSKRNKSKKKQRETSVSKNKMYKSCDSLAVSTFEELDPSVFHARVVLESIQPKSGENTKTEESNGARSTKKPRTAKKARDPFDHPALSRTGRGKKNNESPEETIGKAKKKLFCPRDDFF